MGGRRISPLRWGWRPPAIPAAAKGGGASGADFSPASSDFKMLGAFFCHFPSRNRQAPSQAVEIVGARNIRFRGFLRFQWLTPSRGKTLGAPIGAGADRAPLGHAALGKQGASRRTRSASAVYDAGFARTPRARVPHLVASRLPRPYHFPARIQSFQAVAAPLPGNAVAWQEIC